jgi:hypothetical protein
MLPVCARLHRLLSHTTTSYDRALFKGIGPRIARSAPQYGVMLLAFELMQKVLQQADR